MKYRKLGKTGLNVSEIGFGCGNVGGLFVRGTYEDQLNAMKRALELGINYFDTAPAYGNGQSEENLGRILNELDPNVIVASKVRVKIEDFKDIRGKVQSSLEKSLERLHLDSIDILQLHSRIAIKRDDDNWPGSISIDDVLGENGVTDVFENLRSQGLVKFAGFTGLGEVAALHKVIDSDRFDIVQSYFNILNPSAGYAMPAEFSGYDFDRLIARAAEHKMGVAAIRVLAGGATGGASSRTGYASPKIARTIIPGGEYTVDEARVQKLSHLLYEDSSSLPQAAIRFALMHSGISVVLIGFSNLSHLEEAVACSEKGPLPESFMNKLKALWAENFTRET
jgi:L-galactose dehydrogenase/L-glyceraldehyde 3-phosphate reductase